MGKILDIAPTWKRFDYKKRLRQREQFEREVQAEGIDLLNKRVAGYVGSSQSSNYAISQCLVRRMLDDQSLTVLMAELQQMPVGDEAKAKRMEALEIAIDRHMPKAVREVLPGATVIGIESGDNKNGQ